MTIALRNKGEVVEIDILDDIGRGFFADGITAQSIRDSLKGAKPSRISVKINSLGGEVFDGVAIYNIIRGQGVPVDVRIEGVAASIASVIAMAGDTITMGRGALMMIHRASGVTFGNAEDHFQSAAMLEKIDGEIAGFYSSKGKISKDEAQTLMEAETWFTAAEALDQGLATDIDESEAQLQAVAFAGKDRIAKFKNAPESLRRFVNTEQVPPAAEKEGGDKCRQKEDTDMELKDLTVDELKAQRPDLVSKIEAAAPRPIDPEIEKQAEAKGTQAERERSAGILAEAKRLRMIATGEELISNGTPLADAIGILKEKALAKLVADGDQSDIGANAEPTQPERAEDRLTARINKIIAENPTMNYSAAMIRASAELKGVNQHVRF